MAPGDDTELRMVRKQQDRAPDWGLFAPAARTTDPQTSKRAERDVRPRRGSQALKLLRAYLETDGTLGGLTDEQAARYAGLGAGAWKRCSDLRRAGYIEPTGQTTLSSFGSAVQVCRITASGIARAQEGR